MQEFYSRSQSASLTIGFNTEEEADKWISENQLLDSNYGLDKHTTYRKQENQPDGWLVKRNYYYEEKSVDGKICCGTEEGGAISDERGSDTVGEGGEGEVEATGV